MTELTIPALDETSIRLAALEMATSYCDCPHEAMALADVFANYIDNGGGTVRVECSAEIAAIIND